MNLSFILIVLKLEISRLFTEFFNSLIILLFSSNTNVMSLSNNSLNIIFN